MTQRCAHCRYQFNDDGASKIHREPSKEEGSRRGVARRVVRLSSARCNEDDGYQIVEAVVSRRALSISSCAGPTDIGLRMRHCAMARTYREVAIEEMLGTVEEAMHRVLNCWVDLPPSMKEAIEQFRTQLGTAIDSVEFVKRALDREVHETELRLD